MDARLVELYVERGRLRERISVQRGQLVRELEPLRNALDGVDRTRALLHQARQWVLSNPGIVATVAVAVVVWRPRAVLRTVVRGFSVWRSLGHWRNWIRVGLRVF
ncbi:MAG: YqjK family protein [Pseudomonadota bacterium]